MAQEYEDAGEFDFKGKMLKSIKINLKFYSYFFLIGIAYLVYLLLAQKNLKYMK